MNSSEKPPEDVMSVESGVDVVLLLLIAPGITGRKGEPIKGITRLQKLLFLLWKEGQLQAVPNDLYGFKAYDFGPCMDDLYDDLEFAQDIGLIEIQEVPSGNEYEGADENAFLNDFGFRLQRHELRRDFKLTSSGTKAAEDLLKELSAEDRKSLYAIKAKYNSKPFFQLLRYVYSKYPKFAVKSVLKGLC